MKRLSLVSLSFLTHLLLVTLSLTAATLMGGWLVDKALELEAQRTLDNALPIFSARLAASDTPSDPRMIDAVCKRLFTESGYRFTVMGLDGEVLGDGEGDPVHMRNHADRPEFRAALRQGTGSDRRTSDSVHREMVYVSRLLELEPDTTIVVRAAVGTELLRAPLRRLWAVWRWLALLLLAAAAALSYLSAHRILSPLLGIRQRVADFENGRFDRSIPRSRLKDLDQLALDLNRMAQRLENRIRTVERQRDEEDALLRCMIEGVVAVDMEKNILRINRSAARLLDVKEPSKVVGLSVYTLIRNPDWIALLERVLAGESPVEGFVELIGRDQALQIHGAALTAPDGQRIGALLVFNDVTALYRVETMQRDFVANVSHELKTPITSIKGFAETLLDGEEHDPAARQRFLQIIRRQADRLHSIVTDILSLAALEHGTRGTGAERETVRLDEMLENALLPCRTLAAERGTDLQTSCPEEVDVEVYPFFMEQAVINLVDNAIKFSPPGRTVAVQAQLRGGALVISVRDDGPGIGIEHHERVWERFYRVDPGRSRQSGGTGLGLAIVKRVADLHGGRVELDSTPGAGSTFRLIVPLHAPSLRPD